MEKRRDLVDAVATPFDGLDLVVQPFNKSTGYPLVEVVENVVPVSFQGFDEAIVTADRAQANLVTPRADGSLCLSNTEWAIENGGQLFSESVGLMEQERVPEQAT